MKIGRAVAYPPDGAKIVAGEEKNALKNCDTKMCEFSTVEFQEECPSI
jgi:hypothetical protein